MLYINSAFDENTFKNYLHENIGKYPNFIEIYILQRHTSNLKKETQHQLGTKINAWPVF